MKAPWPVILLTRREIVAIVLTVTFVLGMFSVQLYFKSHKISAGVGLGAEWDCSNPGEGSSVCVKLPKRTETSP